MTDPTVPARADDAAYLRWIGVLGLAHATSMASPCVLAQLDLPRPVAHGAMASII
jgi:hypothetical protein